MASVTWLRANRLAAQRLSGRPCSPLEAIRALGAVQAQNVGAARWAVGVRCPGSSLADVDALFASGAVLRSWTMRGTLHLVMAEDLGWMLSLTSARQRAAVDREAQQRGIPARDFEAACDAICAAITAHGPRTRAEALAAVERVGLETGDERGYRYIRDAALRGLVAWGPYRGPQPQLVLLPHTDPVDDDEALARFLIRYAAGHGPVTVRDFAWWSGLTLTRARRAREIAADALDDVHVGDDEFLIAPFRSASPVTPDTYSSRPRGVRAIAAWDEYVLGYADRSAMLTAEHAGRLAPTGNGVFLPSLVSAGRVVGTWKQSVRRGVLTLVAAPFAALSAAERRGVFAEATRLARFLGVDVGDVVIP